MKVERSIEVAVPVRTAYDQWTQFEEFPHFMSGVTSVQQLDDKHLRWEAEIFGVKREWTATILEQVPDTRVAWAAIEGATNAGAIDFSPIGADRTALRLELEHDPEGLVEKVGDALHLVEKQAEGDLERFKAFIEDAGYATGAWRGTLTEGAGVGTPGTEAAAASKGDSGKAGLSVKAVVAGAATAAAGVAAAASVLRGGDDDADQAVPEPSGEPTPMIAPEVEAALVAETVETDRAVHPDEPDAGTEPVDIPLAETSVVDPAEGAV